VACAFYVGLLWGKEVIGAPDVCIMKTKEPKCLNTLRFEVLTAVRITIMVFWI
jgi:hypothetical protein